MNNLKKIKIAISSLPQNGWWNNGIVAYHDNDMMSNGAHPNQILLKEEHLSLIKTLNKYSLNIMEIPFKQELETYEKYDFVFMRDHFLCNTNKDIVMCNMKLSERMNEGEFVISNLENIGYNIVIYPVTTQRLAMKNVEDGLRAIFDDGHQNNIIDKMQTRKRLYELVDYEKYNSLDEKIYNFSTDGHE